MNVEQFLYHEARLLDTQRYEEWLELFTDDATYWVPLEKDQKDPYETSSIIHDDRTLLELRVKQARHPRAHARQPLARTVRADSRTHTAADRRAQTRERALRIDTPIKLSPRVPFREIRISKNETSQNDNALNFDLEHRHPPASGGVYPRRALSLPAPSYINLDSALALCPT